MNDPDGSGHPMAEALQWVGRIASVGLVMVIPGLVGEWLDRQWGTSFLALLGFVFGLTVGVYVLMVMTGALGRKPGRNRNRGGQNAAGEQRDTDEQRGEQRRD